jgi:hypothetical protein
MCSNVLSFFGEEAEIFEIATSTPPTGAYDTEEFHERGHS